MALPQRMNESATLAQIGGVLGTLAGLVMALLANMDANDFGLALTLGALIGGILGLASGIVWNRARPQVPTSVDEWLKELLDFLRDRATSRGLHRSDELVEHFEEALSRDLRAKLVRYCSAEGSAISDTTTHPVICLVGPAGSGKSSILRQVEDDLLKRISVPAANSLPLPILVDLRRYGGGHSLSWFIQAILREDGFAMPRKLLESLALSGRIVLLLDGVDEVPKAHLDSCLDMLISFSAQAVHLKAPVRAIAATREEEGSARLSEHYEMLYMPELPRGPLLDSLASLGPSGRRVAEALQGREDVILLCRFPLWRTVVASLVIQGSGLPPQTTDTDVEAALLRRFALIPRAPGWSAVDYAHAKTLAELMTRSGVYSLRTRRLDRWMLSTGRGQAWFLVMAFCLSAIIIAPIAFLALRELPSSTVSMAVVATAVCTMAFLGAKRTKEEISTALRFPTLTRFIASMRVRLPITFGREILWTFPLFTILFWIMSGLGDVLAAIAVGLSCSCFVTFLATVAASQQDYYRGLASHGRDRRHPFAWEALVVAYDYAFYVAIGAFLGAAASLFVENAPWWPLQAPLGFMVTLLTLSCAGYLSRAASLDSWILQAPITIGAAVLSRAMPLRLTSFLARAEAQSLIRRDGRQLAFLHRSLQEALADHHRDAVNSDAHTILQSARRSILDGRPDAARKAMKGFVVQESRSPEELHAAADVFTALGQLDASLDASLREAELTEKGARRVALSNAAHTAIAARRYEHARKCAQQAIAADSSSKSAFLYLAVLDWIEGDEESARRNARTSLRRAGSFVVGAGYLYDSVACLILGNQSEALTFARWANELGHEVRADPLLLALLEAEQPPAGIDDFQAALER